MVRLKKFRLGADEIRVVEQAIRQAARPEVSQRATAVLMLHLGRDPSSVAEMFSVSIGTIYNWHRRWRIGGLGGLANQPRSGRPRIADEAYLQILQGTLEQNPSEFGYEFQVWTTERLREHLEQETGKLLSVSQFRAVLKRTQHQLTSPEPVTSRREECVAEREVQKELDIYE